MITLNRLQDNGVNTSGTLSINGAKFCDTLELSWLDNQQNISCIPAGTYAIERYLSENLGECFAIQNVPNRANILIHDGNFASSNPSLQTDTDGCILVGNGFGDIDNNGQLNILNSKKTLYALMATLPETQYKLEII